MYRPAADAGGVEKHTAGRTCAPLADGLIGHDHAALEEKCFHITETEAEAKVEPYHMADECDGKAVVLIAVFRIERRRKKA
jgi:hypothetical protein